MKEIKAFVHRSRVADIIHALKVAGFHNISVIDVKGMLKALDAEEQQYSIEIGEKVITEVKLELVCEQFQVDQAIALIRKNGRTGQAKAGWIYISDIQQVFVIDEEGT